MGAKNTKLSQMQFKPVEEDSRATIRFMSGQNYNFIGVHCIGYSEPDARVLYVKGSGNAIEECNHAIVEGDCNYITSKGMVVVTGSFNIIHAKSVEIHGNKTTTNFICWCGRDEKLTTCESSSDGDIEIKKAEKLDKTYTSNGCCLRPITVHNGVVMEIRAIDGNYASDHYEKLGERLRKSNLICHIKSNGQDFNNLDVSVMTIYRTIHGCNFMGGMEFCVARGKPQFGAPQRNYGLKKLRCKSDDGLVVELRDGKRQVFNGDPPPYK